MISTLLIEVIFNNVENLQNQNKLLKEARDLWLPRLMMGLVDVDELVGDGVVYELGNEQLGMVAEEETEKYGK